jgi:hypothetical protein
MHKIVNGIRVELTDEQAQAARARWAAEDAAQAEKDRLHGYLDNRKKAYPKIEDQLDMIYHAMKANEIPRATEWYDIIEGIKTAYPKPITEAKA